MGEKGVRMKSPGCHRLELILSLLAVPVVEHDAQDARACARFRIFTIPKNPVVLLTVEGSIPISLPPVHL